MSRRIMHPTDFSPASRPAFDKAIAMAKADRAELTVVHVLSPVMPVPGDGYISPKVYDEIAASSKAWAQKELDRRVKKAKGAGVRARALLLDGVPHEQIIRAAKSRRADLLVLGTHGRSGLAKLFIGSVAGRVVSSAPCPVLTVRGKK
jgi:nucleotide-binding universal stress UspA family protein